MILIAHRGNIGGSNPDVENNPDYIDIALAKGFDAEVDVRYVEEKFYLGHDTAQYCISLSWLEERKDNLWIHCKDLKSLEVFSDSSVDFNYFWHQEDDFTLTSKKYIWTYPGKPYGKNSIVVMPEWNTGIDIISEIKKYKCKGICSDYIGVS